MPNQTHDHSPTITTNSTIPPVLLGPESGRKVAEHLAPDPRDEAVGLLRRIVALLDECPCLYADGVLHYEARYLLFRIDK